MKHPHSMPAVIASVAVVTLLVSAGPAALGENVKWGPLRMTVGASAGATYTDNVNLSNDNRKSDVFFDMGPDLSAELALGPQFNLPGGEEFRITLSGSYRMRYSVRDGSVQTYGAPITAYLFIPLYIRYLDWTVTISDTFDHTRSTAETFFGSGQQDTPVYSNRAQLSAYRNFGKLNVNIGAHRMDQIALAGSNADFGQSGFDGNLSFALNEVLFLFCNNTYDITDARNGASDSTSLSTIIGVGASGQILQRLSGSLRVGYEHLELNSDSPNGDTTLDRPYVSADLNFGEAVRLRPYTLANLSLFWTSGYTGALSPTAADASPISEAYGVRCAITHPLTQESTITPSASWTRVLEIGGGPNQQEASIIQTGLDLHHAFSRKMSGTLSYTYQNRLSNSDGESYEVNMVRLSISYTF